MYWMSVFYYCAARVTMFYCWMLCVLLPDVVCLTARCCLFYCAVCILLHCLVFHMMQCFMNAVCGGRTYHTMMVNCLNLGMRTYNTMMVSYLNLGMHMYNIMMVS